MNTESQQLELGKEYPGAGEAEIIEQIVQIFRNNVTRDYPVGNRPARRAVHPKMHACLRAEFIVGNDVPDDLRLGVFRMAQTYPAWIRFSNGNPAIQPDTTNDAHGMAIKVMDVDGAKVLEAEEQERTQDFVMIDHPVFFLRTPADFADFSTKVGDHPHSPLVALVAFAISSFSHPREALLAVKTLKHINNPLSTQYWSQTPYRLGPMAVKFSARPRSPENSQEPASQSPSYLYEVMAEQLRRTDAWFDFLVQAQTDPVAMPVEDPTVEWDEEVSPYRKVAAIRIPAQVFDTPERIEFGEHLSFNPWHTLPEHQPLGGINRVRQKVYQAISRLRHELNGIPPREPMPEADPH